MAAVMRTRDEAAQRRNHVKASLPRCFQLALFRDVVVARLEGLPADSGVLRMCKQRNVLWDVEQAVHMFGAYFLVIMHMAKCTLRCSCYGAPRGQLMLTIEMIVWHYTCPVSHQKYECFCHS